MNILYLSILFPLISFLLLIFFKTYFSEKFSALIGISGIGLCSLISIYCLLDFLTCHKKIFKTVLWQWIKIEKFNINVGFLIDSLTLSMLFVITVIGFFIHVFSSWYMRGESRYPLFFAYTNLFIFNMLILVLSDNFLLMYFGWEGVGFCSYLLIGFYYQYNKNVKSAIKAFIITRISDIFLLFAILIFWNELGTLNFYKISVLAPEHFKNNHYLLTCATLMLLIGAIGKSAQLPLHTWLVDAMVGPTPVSALIHAATMVTSGIYLIARNKSIFLLTPNVLYLIEIIGVATMIIAGCAAIFQVDIKKILAYSTMSQIGYMFIALGSKAWLASVHHLMTHAFFKALLFLSAGSLIVSCCYEQNIFSMRSIRKKTPLIYLCFLVGGASLTSIPWITSGFFSKEDILIHLLENKHFLVFMFSLLGLFITTLYTFRMIFILFYGEKCIFKKNTEGVAHNIPLIILLILSTSLGTIITIPLQDYSLKTSTLSYAQILTLKIFSIGIISCGVLLAKNIWITHNHRKKFKSAFFKYIVYWWCSTNGFNWYYEKIFFKTYLFIVNILKTDPISNKLKYFTEVIIFKINKIFCIIQNGYLRWYINIMVFSTAIILIFLLKIKII